MVEHDPQVWVVHSGQAATPGSPFFSKKVVAFAWIPKHDLSQLAPDRGAFRELVAKAWPERAARGPGSVGVAAGQLFRFIHEMRVRDLVVLPLKHRDEVQLGWITGPYRHDTAGLPDYPHTRAVKWLGAVPKSRFSPEAIREMGSALSLFLVTKHAREFVSAAESS
jgi:restriction system protein